MFTDITNKAVDTIEPRLSKAGLHQFLELRRTAVESVAARFLAEYGAVYAPLGPSGREAWREDIEFHLEFLRPALEFGLQAPLADYLRWLAGDLTTRGIPVAHVGLSLEWLAGFFAARMNPPEGAVVATALRSAMAMLDQQPCALPPVDVAPPEEWPECSGFEEALLAGDHHRAAAIVEGCLANGKGLVPTEMHLIQPALYRIGKKWQDNQVSVAQEHLATAIAHSVMTAALLQSEPPPPNGRKVLLACVEGNQHALGLQMVADAFQLSGWEVQYLGADVPTAALMQQVSAWQPHLVGLSIAFPRQLREVRKFISTLQETMGSARPPVIVGGLAVNAFHKLADQSGAEGWSADAASAVSTGSELTGSQLTDALP